MRERGAGGEGSAKEIIYHLPQVDQYPAILQAMVTLEAKTPPFFCSSTALFITEYVVKLYGISLWAVQITCLGCVPSESRWGGTEWE